MGDGDSCPNFASPPSNGTSSTAKNVGADTRQCTCDTGMGTDLSLGVSVNLSAIKRAPAPPPDRHPPLPSCEEGRVNDLFWTRQWHGAALWQVRPRKSRPGPRAGASGHDHGFMGVELVSKASLSIMTPCPWGERLPTSRSWESAARKRRIGPLCQCSIAYCAFASQPQQPRVLQSPGELLPYVPQLRFCLSSEGDPYGNRRVGGWAVGSTPRLYHQRSARPTREGGHRNVGVLDRFSSGKPLCQVIPGRACVQS